MSEAANSFVCLIEDGKLWYKYFSRTGSGGGRGGIMMTLDFKD